MLQYILPFLPFIYISYILYLNYTSLPSSLPSPSPWSRLTNLPRLLSVYNRSPHLTQLTLHKNHGPFIRLGPNMISIIGTSYTSQIYGIGKGLIKSDFYTCFQNIVNGQRAASLVAMTDESDHARTKRVVANAYSLSTLVEFDGIVDETVNALLDVLGVRFAKDGQVCDLGLYLQYFAFDVIGELTFSKRLGFLEQGQDVDGIIGAIGANFAYFSVLGQMPWLDDWLGKNPIYIKYFRRPVSSPILLFAQKLLQERLAGLEDVEREKLGEKAGAGKPDFLARFLNSRKEVEDAEMLADGKLLSYLFMNINAGSDTVASTTRAIFHYLFTHPTTLLKLRSELDNAKKDGNIQSTCPTWHESQSLKYLNAVIKEGLRLNPALSLPLERVVPAAGITLTSTGETETLYLPPGTVVGINPYVQHRLCPLFASQTTSGEPAYPDLEAWEPERWLTRHEEETKEMEHGLLTFGAGKRSCLGRNIAMLELCKVVPALVAGFEFRLVEGAEWRVVNKWALEQTGLQVRFKAR